MRDIMNKNLMGAFVLSAVMILSGCANSADNSEGSSAEQSTQSAQSTQSSSTVSSSAQSSDSTGASSSTAAPNSHGSSSAAVSVPEISTVPSSSEPPEVSAPEASTASSTETSTYEKPVESSPETSSDTSTPEIPVQAELPSNRSIIEADDTRTVKSGETFTVKGGEMLEVKGTLIVESGAAITVEKGAVLFVDESVRLDGDLVLSEGGRLIMGRDEARIDGGGSVAVKSDFKQIDCERGTIKAHITPPERVVTNGVTTVGGVVIANKAITLPPEYGSHLSSNAVEPEVYAAHKEMSAAANHTYVNRSGYRSYWDQKVIFQNYCNKYGYEKADTFSSHAGHSEHQTGLTMDLDSFSDDYGDTPAGKWLAENCWRYGFIIRYPKGKDQITGYKYEPWHVRYLGKSTAKLVFDSGLTLEEFLNVEGGTTVID
ncbi:MAG: M15 family metallopeptidase [Oscillospiraceae bacterium]|nr:M15 family metallopeptidase [Oscillospiraceae bacterium]